MTVTVIVIVIVTVVVIVTVIVTVPVPVLPLGPNAPTNVLAPVQSRLPNALNIHQQLNPQL